jgi:hypothetical protein
MPYGIAYIREVDSFHLSAQTRTLSARSKEVNKNGSSPFRVDKVLLDISVWLQFIEAVAKPQKKR